MGRDRCCEAQGPSYTLGCLGCGRPCCAACVIHLESAAYCAACARALLDSATVRPSGPYTLH
jgi:hypothetical protein